MHAGAEPAYPFCRPFQCVNSTAKKGIPNPATTSVVVATPKKSFRLDMFQISYLPADSPRQTLRSTRPAGSDRLRRPSAAPPPPQRRPRELDLAREYRSAYDLRPGLELRHLYPDEADESSPLMAGIQASSSD